MSSRRSRSAGGMHPDDVEAMEEVLPERAGAYARFEVLVRRRDDAHVDPNRHVAADPIELAVGQHAEQTRLELGRHVPDLVEEQRAAVGLLEPAETPGLGAGEGAALVTEELGLEQLARDRGGIEGDERAARSRAVSMQRPRDQLLAGARLAGDEHREVRSAEPPDCPEHLLHRGRRADDPRRRRRHRPGVAVRVLPVVGDCSRDQGHRLVDVERLRQVLVRTTLVGGHCAVQIGVAGHDDHREMRVASGDLAEQLQSVDVRHADVGDDRVRLALPQSRVDAGAALESLDREPGATERALQHPPDRPVVVDDPHLARATRARSPNLARAAHERSPRSAMSIGSRMLNVVSPGRLAHSMIPPCS